MTRKIRVFPKRVPGRARPAKPPRRYKKRFTRQVGTLVHRRSRMKRGDPGPTTILILKMDGGGREEVPAGELRKKWVRVKEPGHDQKIRG